MAPRDSTPRAHLFPARYLPHVPTHRNANLEATTQALLNMLHPTALKLLSLTFLVAHINPLAHAAPQAAPPGPSAIPECTYACPALDKAGWQAVPFMDPSPTEIFCSYPTVVNENPLDFYCIYSKVRFFILYFGVTPHYDHSLHTHRVVF